MPVFHPEQGPRVVPPQRFGVFFCQVKGLGDSLEQDVVGLAADLAQAIPGTGRLQPLAERIELSQQ